MTFAFRIIGTVYTETIDEALRAITAYTDPDNDAVEDSDDPSSRIQAMSFQWLEVNEAAELGGTYDSGDVARLLDAARRG